MAKKDQLRDLRNKTVINTKSKRQEKALDLAIRDVREQLYSDFPGVSLVHESEWKLRDIVGRLRIAFPSVPFFYFHETSSMRPDGGVLSIRSSDDRLLPILIAEKKNQGTNDLRLLEGRARQAKGNAIERLGKNVIGFRAAMLDQGIFPFVCFGDGCDFSEDSSILDRVVTIAMFGELNKEHVHRVGECGEFGRGSFYFRVAEWSRSEMAERCLSVAKKSIYYYFSRYGEDVFRST
jgi:type II restriction enzyme